MICPCKSNKTFAECCQPIINKEKLPTSPEQLMRSRYSAYASKNAEYIFNTYSEESRKSLTLADISYGMDNCLWRHLIVHYSEQNEQTGTVEFSAFYIENKQLYVMREKSYFIKDGAQWSYHTGEMITHNAFKKISRNDLCPCQQGKKFKQCCALYL